MKQSICCIICRRQRIDNWGNKRYLHMAKDNNSKNGFLLLSQYRTAIMGFAALWILFFHIWEPLFEFPSESGFNLFAFLEHFIKRIGFSGVDIFLLLSGSGLTYAIKKETLSVFYVRRLRRTFPPFLLVAVLRCFFEKWTVFDFLGKISGYYFYTKHIYSFLWFVPAIITFYIFFPLYYKLFSKVKYKWLLTSGVIAIWAVITFFVRGTMRIDLFAFTNRIPIFVTGVFVGYLTQNYKETVFKTRTYLILTVIFSIGLYLSYLYNFRGFLVFVPQGNTFLPNFLIAISLPFLLAKLLDVINRHIKLLGKILLGFLGFFGAISLELYCFQDWFEKAIPYLEYFGWSHLLSNLALFFISIALAWVTSKIFKILLWELPEKNKAKKKSAKIGT